MSQFQKTSAIAIAIVCSFVLVACGSGTAPVGGESAAGGESAPQQDRWVAWGVLQTSSPNYPPGSSNDWRKAAYAGEVGASLSVATNNDTSMGRTNFPDVEIVATANASNRTKMWSHLAVLPSDAGHRDPKYDGDFDLFPLTVGGTSAFAVFYTTTQRQDGINVLDVAAGRVAIYRADNGEEMSHFNTATPQDKAFAAANDRVLVRSAEQVIAYDATSGTPAWTANAGSQVSKLANVNFITEEPAGYFIRTGYPGAGYMVVNAANGQTLQESAIDNLKVVATDGSLVINRANTTDYFVVNATTGSPIGNPVVINCAQAGICITPLKASSTRTEGKPVQAVAYDPDHKMLIGTMERGQPTDPGIAAWNVESGEKAWEIPNSVLPYNEVAGVSGGMVWLASGDVGVNSVDGKQVCGPSSPCGYMNPVLSTGNTRLERWGF